MDKFGVRGVFECSKGKKVSQLKAVSDDSSPIPAQTTCPLAGLPGPELVVGDWKRALESTLRSHAAEALTKAYGPTDAERSQLLLESNRAKARLLSVLEVKLHFYNLIPHALLGVAHPNEDLARAAAIKCLHQVKDVPVGKLHSLAKNMQGSSAVALQMQAFASGEARANLPDLWQALMPLQYIRTTECTIEGKHALAKNSA